MIILFGKLGLEHVEHLTPLNLGYPIFRQTHMEYFWRMIYDIAPNMDTMRDQQWENQIWGMPFTD